jgi:hypothetical protein
MLPPAPASIVALLLASLAGLTLVVIGARDLRVERGLLLGGLGLAGFGAAGIVDVLFGLGSYPLSGLFAGAALMLASGVALARARA